jgi:hypothetical protein
MVHVKESEKEVERDLGKAQGSELRWGWDLVLDSLWVQTKGKGLDRKFLSVYVLEQLMG